MAELLEYKCPFCGAKLEFDSSLQQMKCPFCDSVLSIDAVKKSDDILDKQEADLSDDMTWEKEPGGEWDEHETDGMAVFTCKSCGGEIIGDENTGATECPFCGNPVIMTGRFSGDLKPDYVIPFKLDKKAAKAALMNHLKGKKLLPKVFKDENHIDEIKGIYVPFWLFETDANATIKYTGTMLRCWRDSKYDYTETSYFDILRAGNMSFDHVPVDGSSKMADDLMESIEPFDFSEAVDFQTAYLSGYFADKYDVDEKASIERANTRIKQSAKDALSNTVMGYTTLSVSSEQYGLSNSCAKYALYPVWLLNTTWNGKQYTFAMNGQTGKFVGNLPCDKSLATKYGFLYGGIFAVISFAALTLFHIL